MKTIKNQAAFPLKHSDDKFNPGMTLRDYFAGQIIAGIISNNDFFDLFKSSLKQSTYIAYELADELLIARQQDESQNNR
jgi:hypothetical protein